MSVIQSHASNGEDLLKLKASELRWSWLWRWNRHCWWIQDESDRNTEVFSGEMGCWCLWVTVSAVLRFPAREQQHGKVTPRFSPRYNSIYSIYWTCHSCSSETCTCESKRDEDGTEWFVIFRWWKMYCVSRLFLLLCDEALVVSLTSGVNVDKLIMKWLNGTNLTSMKLTVQNPSTMAWCSSSINVKHVSTRHDPHHRAYAVLPEKDLKSPCQLMHCTTYHINITC